MGLSFIDKWLVAEGCDDEGTNSGRWYIIHTQYPRFVIEICDRDDGGYESGESEVFDDCLDAAIFTRLSREAGEIFASYDRDLLEES
uniref:Uncharacterized protein n=1 Tax=viral metagenome TaxID=1070528 RepID=A0A6M3JCA5_9ZZZZ